MTRPGPARRNLPALALVATVSLALGVLTGLADGRTTTTNAPPAPAAVKVPPAPAPPTAALPFPKCAPPKAPAAEPVPQAILDAFAVLRRDRTDDDALPDDALAALRARGLEPFDPAAARLLRTTADGGKAWVVPVRDAAPGFRGIICAVSAPPVDVRPGTPRPRVRRPFSVAPGVPPRPPASLKFWAGPTARAKPPKPRPGLAVVALGGAPAGGGGALDDLVRGRGDVAVAPCSGPSHDMLAISGIVPDGVAAAFLTAVDGTAVRADVHDNAYAFVVAPPAQPQQRYVVWTGADGTPHVQPVVAFGLPHAARCAPPVRDAAQVTPGPGTGCGSANVVFALPPRAAPAPPLPKVPPARARRNPRPTGRPVPVLPAPILATPAVPCAAALPFLPRHR